MTERTYREKEDDLLDRMARGDESSFRDLYFGYHREIHAHLAHVLGDAERARRLTEDVLYEFWTGAAEFRARSRLVVGLTGLAHLKALEVARGEGDGGAPAAAPAPATPPADRKEALKDALARLTVEEREIFMLVLYHGFSEDEIAEITGQSRETVRRRVDDVLDRIVRLVPALAAG